MKKQQLVCGIHALVQLLKHAPQQIVEIYILDDSQRFKEIINLAELNKISIQKINKNKLNSWCAGMVHQGVVASIREQQNLTEIDLANLLDKLQATKNEPLLLVLDEVQDPHNLGAILRTAEAAKVNAVVVPKDRSVGITPVVRKVASGAVDTVPLIRVTNLARSLEELKARGIWLVALACVAEAKSIFTIDLTGAKALVLGAEGRGIRELTIKKCDYVASIPMLGSIESLNVSVATGICLFEALRQRYHW